MNAPDGASPVIVGTIAFGMGLDKKDVRRVFHFNLPKSPENLAQQVCAMGCDKYWLAVLPVFSCNLSSMRAPTASGLREPRECCSLVGGMLSSRYMANRCRKESRRSRGFSASTACFL